MLVYKKGENLYRNMVLAKAAKAKAKRNSLYFDEDVMGAMEGITPEQAAMQAGRIKYDEDVMIAYEMSNNIDLLNYA